MLIRLALIGAAGYAAYRYLQGDRRASEVRLAGGPLSEHATIQSDPDQPPANDPYSD